ncbi:MAG: fimbrillin family protein [Tannerellaceae bacterium]|nr:fimbrillin family protein [Tannerellaceae bacterium]
MRTRYIFIAMASMAFLFAGCSMEEKEDRHTGPYDPSDIPVLFNAGLPTTRTTGSGEEQSEWEIGDSIGIYMVEGTKAFTPASILAENKKYVAINVNAQNADFTWAESGDKMYYPKDAAQTVKFYAYYPYTSAINNLNYDISVPSAQDYTMQGTLDILYNTELREWNKTSGNAVLRFSHKMVKLVFHITDGSTTPGTFTDGLVMTVSSMYEAGTLSLVSGTVKNSTTTRIVVRPHITVFSATSAMAEAIVLPVTDVVKDQVMVTFTKTGAPNTFEASLPPVQGSNQLESGNRYIYDVNLRDRTVTISGIIEDWDDKQGPIINPS